MFVDFTNWIVYQQSNKISWVDDGKQLVGRTQCRLDQQPFCHEVLSPIPQSGGDILTSVLPQPSEALLEAAESEPEAEEKPAAEEGPAPAAEAEPAAVEAVESKARNDSGRA